MSTSTPAPHNPNAPPPHPNRPSTSKPRGVCKYYLEPRGCFAGRNCKFLHGDPMKGMRAIEEKAMRDAGLIGPGEGDGGAGSGGEPSANDRLTPYDQAKTCRFYANGYCKHGAKCWFRHVKPAPASKASKAAKSKHSPKFKGKSAKTETPPKDPQGSGVVGVGVQGKEAEVIEVVGAEDEEEVVNAAAEEESEEEGPVDPEDELCSICFEEPVTFGLLAGCGHVFCITCIKQWRDRTGKTIDVVESGVHKKCPMCRSTSRFVTPSSQFQKHGGKRKERVMKAYEGSMARVGCRYFTRAKAALVAGTGRELFCPFGKDCFYAHVKDDGTPHVFKDGADVCLKKYARLSRLSHPQDDLVEMINRHRGRNNGAVPDALDMLRMFLDNRFAGNPDAVRAELMLLDEAMGRVAGTGGGAGVGRNEGAGAGVGGGGNVVREGAMSDLGMTPPEGMGAGSGLNMGLVDWNRYILDRGEEAGAGDTQVRPATFHPGAPPPDSLWDLEQEIEGPVRVREGYEFVLDAVAASVASMRLFGGMPPLDDAEDVQVVDDGNGDVEDLPALEPLDAWNPEIRNRWATAIENNRARRAREGIVDENDMPHLEDVSATSEEESDEEESSRPSVVRAFDLAHEVEGDAGNGGAAGVEADGEGNADPPPFVTDGRGRVVGTGGERAAAGSLLSRFFGAMRNIL